METGAVIAFRVFGGNNKSAVNKFCREFYGYKDKSNNGKYTYERPGFIDRFKHIRVLRGLIIAKMHDVDEIVTFLKGHNAEVFVREVVLLHSDAQKLSERIQKPSSAAEKGLF